MTAQWISKVPSRGKNHELAMMTGESDKYCEHMNMRSTGSGWNVEIRESGWTASEGRGFRSSTHIVAPNSQATVMHEKRPQPKEQEENPQEVEEEKSVNQEVESEEQEEAGQQESERTGQTREADEGETTRIGR